MGTTTTRWGAEAGRWGVDPRTGQLVVLDPDTGTVLPTTPPGPPPGAPEPPTRRPLGYDLGGTA